MRQKIILIVSVGLNVAFAAAWLISRHNTHSIIAEDAISSTGSTNAGKTQVVVRRQFFSWQELETPDYTAYVANLRMIGC
ncbi:MAG: Peptidoglycan-binding LysM, partial [Pedosphaera sp.]|nr:Peptidoglycan-binding LysM [Pedosphaera sp.]